MQLASRQITDFQAIVWGYFRAHQRSMPWREDPSAYKVLVSEFMLQQTQVSRVIPKFEEFIACFPNINTLAEAPCSEVLTAWSGLGYNRRAKFLHETARKVVSDHDGDILDTFEELVKLPGIGPNTAGAIMTYAHNRPVVFIETNIRTVLFHHFYDDLSTKVSDKELYWLAEQVLDLEHPREWHWALMDYGTHLKRTAGGRLDSSKHYQKQSPLKGSLREMRGRIIKALTVGPVVDISLRENVQADERYEPALKSLTLEGMVTQNGNTISLTGHTDAR